VEIRVIDNVWIVIVPLENHLDVVGLFIAQFGGDFREKSRFHT
jgi:hypothetical protein